MTPRQSTVHQATALSVCQVDDKVGYVIELADRAAVVVVMTPRQAHRFANRTHKAANDAGACRARKASVRR